MRTAPHATVAATENHTAPFSIIVSQPHTSIGIHTMATRESAFARKSCRAGIGRAASHSVARRCGFR